MSARFLSLVVGVTLIGCGGDTAPAGAELAQADADPPAAAAPKTPRAIPTPAPVTAKPLPLPARPAPPKPPPAPRSVSQVVGGHYSPGELARWAAHPKLQANLRLTALRRLERDDAEQAVSVALELVRSKSHDRLLRANAVALLARSTDRRAAPALARLEPDLKRLAKAIGRPE